MEKLIDIIKKTTSYFLTKGIDHPQLTTELIFSHVLKCRRLDLYLQFDRNMQENVLAELRPLVLRRAKGEPIQYVLGESHFCDLKLKVTPDVLIPRPETEELIEKITKIYQNSLNIPLKILDLGTGSGAIALCLAQTFQNSQIIASDKSPAALEIAKINAKRNGIQNVTFLESDWFEKIEGVFDIIVSNPPYLTSDEWETAAPEVKEHEPKIALVAEQEGAADLIKILVTAKKYLKEGGLLCLESGIHHQSLLEQTAKDCSYSKYESLQDLSHRNRFFFAWS
ncbi:MAG: protein-(glutamine-N5) methyltransferase, release factor-specific [Verrucomicrobia bacterium GWC2_42_7]|nr:MAG: protein-(glutamine-N5) methyltransferase, release factor-specific [Verrucomicrobia bacterium GWC2_42_7]